MQYIPFGITAVLIGMYAWSLRRHAHLNWADIVRRLKRPFQTEHHLGDIGRPPESLFGSAAGLPARVQTQGRSGLDNEIGVYFSTLRSIYEAEQSDLGIAEVIQERADMPNQFEDFVTDFVDLKKAHVQMLARILFHEPEPQRAGVWKKFWTEELTLRNDPKELLNVGVGALTESNFRTTKAYSTLLALSFRMDRTDAEQLLKLSVEEQARLGRIQEWLKKL